MLRQLQIINLRQQQISEDVGILLMKANLTKDDQIISDKESILKSYNFPLKEVKELEKIEEFLNEENNYKKFVSKFICTIVF